MPSLASECAAEFMQRVNIFNVVDRSNLSLKG